MWSVVGVLEYPLSQKQQAIVDKLSQQRIVPYQFTPQEMNYLSKRQRAICSLRFNNVSYEDIITLFNLPGPSTLVTVLKLTARGFHWELGEMHGGSHSKLPESFYDTLKQTVNARTMGLNCMRTSEAKQMIYNAVEELNIRAVQRLRLWKAEKLASSFYSDISSWDCSSQYLTSLCERIGIWISTPETLEQARRKYCNTAVIDSFYQKFSGTIGNIEKKYIYNADETGLATKKTFRILTNRHGIRITPDEKEMQHISVMCCYSAAGDKVCPLFMFPKRETDFREFNGAFGFFYGTSTNGWMTAKLFSIWCIIFVSHIQLQRENRILDPNKEVFLFIDGHPSRFAPFGMRFLHRFNIRCIVFPAHCTHVLQPFDVGVASPLKAKYEAKFIEFMLAFRKANQRKPNASEVRTIRVNAFMAAWSSLTIDLLQKSFFSAGIVPFNKDNLAMKVLITDAQVAQNIDIGGRRNISVLNGNEATSPQILNMLSPYYAACIFHGLQGLRFPLNFAFLNAADIWNEWKTGDSNNGKIFSPLPAIFENGSNITRLYQ